MKNKFWKISSIIMAPLSLGVTILEAINHHWGLMIAWSMITTIWIFNVKLYWND